MSDAGASIYVDTDKATNGPEFVLGTGLFGARTTRCSAPRAGRPWASR